jgi:hypothetical protein
MDLATSLVLSPAVLLLTNPPPGLIRPPASTSGSTSANIVGTWLTTTTVMINAIVEAYLNGVIYEYNFRVHGQRIADPLVAPPISEDNVRSLILRFTEVVAELCSHASQIDWMRTCYGTDYIADARSNAQRHGEPHGLALAEAFRNLPTFPATGDRSCCPAGGSGRRRNATTD